MSYYDYQKERGELFTEAGQVKLLKVRDNVNSLLKSSGAVRMQEAISVISGDTWTMLACVDRLVEFNEIREITNGNVAGQHRVFVGVRDE